MTHATCRLTAKNRDRLRNATLGNRLWASFTVTTGADELTLDRVVLVDGWPLTEHSWCCDLVAAGTD